MDIRAAEISAILKQQIANFGTEAEVAEVGQVLSVGDGIARVYGLDSVKAGEMVEFPGGIKGMALSAPAPSSTFRSARACSAAWSTVSATRSTARAPSSRPSAVSSRSRLRASFRASR
jgi:hypothetical protein